MKRAFVALFLFSLAFSRPAAAQTAGAIEFVARVTPAGGLSEPVRGLPFYLLRKSFQEIGKEADAAQPRPEMDAFIDSLEVSKELKSWMKRTHSVSLTGEEFIHRAKVNDIMTVPEFFDAYVERNAGDRSVGFPVAKFRERDKEKDPARYNKLQEEYHEAIRKFLVSNPQSADGMDLKLSEIDPSPKWEQLQASRIPGVRRQTMEMAETKYLVARTETDLDGRGAFSGVAPGNYWLSTLEIDAAIGDIHLRWDTPVTVRAGEVTRTELSNINAVEPHHRSR